MICPFRSLLHLPSEAEKLDALRAARRLLAPGGALIFDVFEPSPEDIAETHGRWLEREPGIWERADWDEDSRTMTLSVRHDDAAASFTLHWLSTAEWHVLIDQAGFDVDALYGEVRPAPARGRGGHDLDLPPRRATGIAARSGRQEEPRMSSQPRAVVGRERELDSLEAVPRCRAGGPVGLWIEGDVGIGKTTLWKHAAAAARERSLPGAGQPADRIRDAACVRGALGDLLEDVDRATRGTPRPQRQALEVALLRREAEGPAPHSRAVALGLLGVLRSLAQPGPVVVAVDDVQWLDSPSASALEFIARRLGEEPIGLLVAQRTETGDAPALNLERALPDDRFERLSVGPLDVEALDRLLRAGLDAQFHRAALEQLHTARGAIPSPLEIAKACSSARYR